MTRARTKKAKEALTQLVAKVLEFKPTLESMEGKMVMCIKPLEEGWGASLAAHFIQLFLLCCNKSVRDQFWPKNTKYGYFVCLIHFKASKALNGMFCVFISCKGVLKTKEKQGIEKSI